MRWRTLLVLVAMIGVLAACGGATPPAADSGRATPDGRIMTADQGANTVSVIDVATNEVYATIPTGQAPHHVVSSPDGREIWVTLYKENHLQVFDAKTLKELGQVDVGGPSDDLTFAPDGKRLYASMGADNMVAVIVPAARKLVSKVGVGQTPHGVMVRPEG
jgi:YVTN family beta-propeller protein